MRLQERESSSISQRWPRRFWLYPRREAWIRRWVDMTTLILETLQGSPGLQERGVRHVEEIQLLSAGIGPDRVSDIAANVLKRFLIGYTQRQCDIWNLDRRPTSQSNTFTIRILVAGLIPMRICPSVPSTVLRSCSSLGASFAYSRGSTTTTFEDGVRRLSRSSTGQKPGVRLRPSAARARLSLGTRKATL